LAARFRNGVNATAQNIGLRRLVPTKLRKSPQIRYRRLSGVSGSSRTFNLGPARRHAKARTRVVVSLKVSKRALATVRRALACHRQVRAQLTITARDRAGNETHKRRVIRLRR